MATCMEEGETTYTCTNCGQTKKESIPISDHTPVSDGAVTPTCIRTGLTEGSHCSACGEVIKAQEIVKANGHTVVTDDAIEPTCTRPGLTEGSHCSVCGEVIKEQETVKANGHTVVTDSSIAPTCSAEGLTEGSHCSVCGEVLVAQKKVDQLEHDWDEGVVTTEPTCTESGVRVCECKLCHDKKDEVVPSTGHKIVADEAVERTCTKAGLSVGSHCSKCGKIFIHQQELDPLGHLWSEGFYTKEPTCTKAGVYVTTCERCGEAEEETVPATGHSWDEGTVTKTATCTENGVMTYKCELCGEEKTETIAASGHKIVKDKAVSATTTKTGLTEGSHCSVCGKILQKQEEVPKLSPSQTEPTNQSSTTKTVKNGWKKESGKWYYYVKDVKQKGWKKIGKKWYFFKKDGSMASNEWCKGYWLNKDGTWTYKKKATWKKDKTSWWFGCKGWYAKKQWQKIDDKWYYFDANGYITTGTKKIGGKTYRFNNSGACLNP